MKKKNTKTNGKVLAAGIVVSSYAAAWLTGKALRDVPASRLIKLVGTICIGSTIGYTAGKIAEDVLNSLDNPANGGDET